MTDNAPNAPLEKELHQATVNPAKLSHQQISALKSGLINNLKEAFNNFITTCRCMPACEKEIHEAFEYFDAGFLMMQKGIILLPPSQLPVINIPQQKAPEEPAPQDENKEAQETTEPKLPDVA